MLKLKPLFLYFKVIPVNCYLWCPKCWYIDGEFYELKFFKFCQVSYGIVPVFFKSKFSELNIKEQP